MNKFTVRSIPTPLCASLVAILAVGCAAERMDVRDEVRDLVGHGSYEEAVRMAADAAARAPADLELERLHRDASVAYLLEQGRRLSFDDHDEEALEKLVAARALDPESKQVADWIEKTNSKIAERWLDDALELHAKDDIDGALAAYESSLRYAPGERDALSGRDLCLAILDHRAGLGRTYFDEGLQALAAYWLEQARSRFSYAHKYKPEDPRTGSRKSEVEELLASERVSLGRQAESEHTFGAALAEYRIALVLEPGNAEAKAGVERARTELDVAALLARASMEVVRGRFDLATGLVEEAAAKTGAQKDQCEGAFAAIREARLERAYQAALALERDHRYEESVTAYAEILANADFYKDVIARKDMVEEYVHLAWELYGQAAAEPDPAAKLGILQRIRAFWPDYKDIEEQIKALTPPPPPSGSGS